MVHTFSPWLARRSRVGGVIPVLALLTTLGLGGCASVPPPDGSMNQAQSALQSARDAGAPDYDPVDFGFAQDKFQQAQSAMADRKYALAGDLADESRADAQLARTKAMLGAARAQIQSKTDANTQLRSQNQAAQSENDQHYQQQKQQLAAQQAAAQQAAAGDDNGDNANGGDNGSNPAPAGSAAAPQPAPLPQQAPVEQDMPAPSASVLNAPAPAQPSSSNYGQQNQGGQ